ncbi:GntP family permease, partial [Acidobacteria bacterium AH-259-G07]|nr:GntP family permease [Acidobacteria bacterium AH-259-G07]
MIVVVGGVLLLRLHAFLALLLGALVVSVLTPPGAIEQFALEKGISAIAAKQLSEATIGERVAQGFGRTCGQIGIIIAMASIIGTCLLKSGSADRIVRSTLNLLGEHRAPFAFLGSGFLLGIPVFFDTVFYLMIPLGKAMRMRTGKNYLLYVLTIVA